MNKKAKFDFDSRAQGLMDAAEKTSSDRWEKAAHIVSLKPSGLTPLAEVRAETTVIEEIPPRSTPLGTSDSHHAVPSDVIMAKISLVRDNPRNARKLYDPLKIALRAASIRQDGQITPAPACLDWENPGQYILIGGHYRKKALILNGVDEIQLKILPAKNNLDLYRLSYIENDERDDSTPMDDALSWQEMLDAGDVKVFDDIAPIVKKPRSTISKTLSLLNLPPEVLGILKLSPDKFTLTAGYELTLMQEHFSTAELVAFATKVADGLLATRELSRLREERKKPKLPRKLRDISRQHKIIADGTEIGTIKDWDSGKVVLEVNFTDPSERQRLVDELRDRFGLTAEAAQMSIAR